MKRIYIYLGKRDKKGIKILAVLKGPNHPATRIPDIIKLGLPIDLEQKIGKQIYRDRMLWEPWIESAEDFTELKKMLENRGFTRLPLSSSPMFELQRESVVKTEQDVPKLLINPLAQQPKTMIRKSKI